MRSTRMSAAMKILFLVAMFTIALSSNPLAAHKSAAVASVEAKVQAAKAVAAVGIRAAARHPEMQNSAAKPATSKAVGAVAATVRAAGR
jgi:hypothetical protein